MKKPPDEDENKWQTAINDEVLKTMLKKPPDEETEAEKRHRWQREAYDIVMRIEHETLTTRLKQRPAVVCSLNNALFKRHRWRQTMRFAYRCCTGNGFLQAMYSFLAFGVVTSLGMWLTAAWEPFFRDRIQLGPQSLFTNPDITFWTALILTLIALGGALIVYNAQRWYTYCCRGKEQRVNRFKFAKIIEENKDETYARTHEMEYISDDDPYYAADCYLACDFVYAHHGPNLNNFQGWFFVRRLYDDLPFMYTILPRRKRKHLQLFLAVQDVYDRLSAPSV